MSNYLINTISYDFGPLQKDLVISFPETDYYKSIVTSFPWDEFNIQIIKDSVLLKAKFTIEDEDEEEKDFVLFDDLTAAFISLTCDLLQKIEFEDASTFVYVSEIKDNVIVESFPFIVSVQAGVGNLASQIFLDTFEEMKRDSKLSMHFFSSPFIVQNYPAIKSKIAQCNSEGYSVELKINKADTTEGTRSVVHFGHYDPAAEGFEDIHVKIWKVANDVLEEQVTAKQPIMVHCYQKIGTLAAVEYLIFRKGLPRAAVSDDFIIESTVTQLDIIDANRSWGFLFRLIYNKLIGMFSS